MDRLVPAVRGSLLPLLKQAPGFKGYCAFASEDGHIVSVSIFDNRQSSARAADQVLDWVMANQKDVLPDPPGIIAGEALLHHVSNFQGDAPDMFAAVRIYEGMPPIEKVLPQVRDQLTSRLRLPMQTAAPQMVLLTSAT